MTTINSLEARVRSARDGLLQLRAQEEMNRKELERLTAEAVRLQDRQTTLARTREVLASIARAKREETTRRLEDIVTAGLRSVLNDQTVSLRVMEHVTKRHVHYRFALSGRGYVSEDIRDEKGGGVINLVSFLLTVVLSVMLDPTQTRFFVFDEKFAHLSRGHLDAAGHLLRELAERLGCQFLVVSHTPELEEYADRVYELTQDRSGLTSCALVR